MNRRTKILAGCLATIVALLALRGAVYARWIEPLVTIDKRLEEKRGALAELQRLEDRVKRAARTYRELVSRAGSFDIDRVAVSVRDRLNGLIEKHHLQAESVSPTRPVEDRKTGAWSLTINIKAVGSLEPVVAFLRDVYELPFPMRVGNVAMYPASSSSRDPREEALMNLRLPIELKVPPQHRLVGRLEETDLAQPESVVRHQGRDYAVLWSGRPFNAYVPPQPLQAEAGKDQNVKVGQDVALRGMATGGDGAYTFQWSGPGVRDGNNQNCSVDTANLPPGEHVISLLVIDGKGRQANDTLKLVVKETVAAKPTKPVETAPPPPPPPPDPRWKDRQHKQLVMVLGTSNTGSANDELMITDRRSGEISYYKVGDEFDGGTLLFVHQTGGLVRRKDGVFVYPLGAGLDQDIPVEAATEQEELRQAAQRIAPQDVGTLRSGPPVNNGSDARAALGEPASGDRVGQGTVLERFDPSDGVMGPGIPPLGPTLAEEAASTESGAASADAAPAGRTSKPKTPPQRSNRPGRGPRSSK